MNLCQRFRFALIPQSVQRLSYLRLEAWERKPVSVYVRYKLDYRCGGQISPSGAVCRRSVYICWQNLVLCSNILMCCYLKEDFLLYNKNRYLLVSMACVATKVTIPPSTKKRSEYTKQKHRCLEWKCCNIWDWIRLNLDVVAISLSYQTRLATLLYQAWPPERKTWLSLYFSCLVRLVKVGQVGINSLLRGLC